MKENIKHIKFDNQTFSKSFFEIVKIEELLKREMDHDIGKNHIVNFYVLFFVTEGEGYHTIDFVDYKYHKGTVLLIRKNQIQKFFRSPNVKGYLLVFTEEFIIGHLNQLEAMKSLQLYNELLNHPKIELTTEEDFTDFSTLVRCLEMEYEIKDEYSLGINRSAFHIMITKLFRYKAKTGQQLGKMKYLEEFLSFQSLVEKDCFENKKVTDYASKMGFSSKTLNNISNTIVHKSAKAFIDEISILQIKRLLIGTNKPIKDIAYSTGFEDPSNFFRYFKKLTGSTPEVFRNAHQ